MTQFDYESLSPIHRALFDGTRTIIFKSFSVHTGEFMMNCEFYRESKLMEGCFQTLEDVLLTIERGWSIIFQMELPSKDDSKPFAQYDLGVSLVRDLKEVRRVIITMSLISQESYAAQSVSFFPEGDGKSTIFTRVNGNLIEAPATDDEVAETILSFIATNVPTELCTMMPL